MQKIEFTKQNIPFTQVANGVLYDKEISLKAKGLYAYLYSKPDGWQFSSVRICQETKDGLDGIQSALIELEKAGYLERYRMNDLKVIYKVIFPPIDPIRENPVKSEKAPYGVLPYGKIPYGKIPYINNTDNNNTESNNTDTCETKSFTGKDQPLTSEQKQINEIIHFFEAVNPACKNLYGRKVEREACLSLLKTYSYEQVKRVIEDLLPETNGMEYFPTITTPLQLWQKWASLGTAIKKKQSEKETLQNKYPVI